MTVMRRDNIDLLAPVGSYESLMAAIHAGANSVYFGIENMNMRSRSSNNFTVDDLKKITEIAHDNNVKTYLTVNTIIYDSDIEKMKTVIDAAKKYNVDAVIVSDIAAMKYAKDSNIPVHASTQLNISNFEAIKFFSEFCDAVVLARELSLEQISYISEKIKEENVKSPSGELIKIEAFCHGALCMAISGKCFLSLHEYNYSANRGACLQTCRRAYIVTDKETGAELEIDNHYIMSPKDLSTIAFVDKLIKSGISILKIEGRARSPEYVKVVVETYNQAINAIIDKSYDTEKINVWEDRLKTVFNRGFWEGHYFGRKIGEWSHQYGSKAEKKKVFIGKISNFFSKINVAEILFETNEELKIDDEIIITGPTTGVVMQKVSELRLDLKKTNSVKQKDLFSLKLDEKVRRNDKLYKLVKAAH